MAAAALVLRWGSYLAVLLDRDKPVWPEVRAARTSRISDEEMARINIEASAALAEWIDLYRSNPGGRIYAQLVDRAVCYLPMPRKTSKLKVMTVCLQLAMERPQRSWPEQVLPFGLAEILMITPSRWTLTDASREVRLPA